MPGPADSPEVTSTTLCELAESLRALATSARFEERRLLHGSLELIAELEREKTRLQDERSAALDTCTRLLAEALERERQLAAALDQERARRDELLRALARQRQEFEGSTSWRLSSPVRGLGRLLKRLGLQGSR